MDLPIAEEVSNKICIVDIKQINSAPADVCSN